MIKKRESSNSPTSSSLCLTPTTLRDTRVEVMSTPQPAPASTSNPDANYRAILEYLTKRGHHKAALALTADLDPSSNNNSSGASNPASPAASASGGGKSVGLEDFAERNAPTQPRSNSNQQQGSTTGGGQTPQNQRRRPDQSVAPAQILVDPPSWEKGYHGLRTFVENVSRINDTL